MTHGHRQDALPLGRRRNRGRRHRGAVLAKCLEVAEEKRAVLHDRTTDGAAELIAVKLRRGAGRRLEIPLGRQ